LIGSLRIESWVIVEEAELELGPGLNVLTGETGTGKSIVLGALSLLAGGRGSSDAVRTGADRAVVEAVFDTGAWPDLEAELERRELDAEGHELAVQRSFSRGGRSRVRVGGELVPASTLAELLADRIEISSQHSSQTLLRPEVQSRLLDESGGLLPLRAEVEAGVAGLRALDRELEELRARAEERARRQDFLAFQIREIDDVGLVRGEIEDLGATHARLAHADRLKGEGRGACTALVGDADAGAGADLPNAVDRLAEAGRLLDGLAALDPELEELAARLRTTESELFEVGRDLERYLAKIDADPAHLAQVEERLAAIDQLTRKYGSSEEESSAFRDQAASELDASQGADARIDALGEQREKLWAVVAKASAKLSRGRVKSGRELGKRVEESLGALAMPGASFEASLDPVSPPEGLPCGAGGAERVEFRFSANAGEPARPLKLVASGGELSRVFLAVRNALRKSGAGMVLVFDEVDAGIGGRVAERVGRALAELSTHHQVLCITHLPQIAALGDVHFRVHKRERDGETVAGVERVEGDVRLEEIARMAGGESVTDATRRHAAELLGLKAPAGTP
jgi:DNA repair protein RecN (Recombination protein N)